MQAARVVGPVEEGNVGRVERGCWGCLCCNKVHHCLCNQVCGVESEIHSVLEYGDKTCRDVLTWTDVNVYLDIR